MKLLFFIFAYFTCAQATTFSMVDSHVLEEIEHGTIFNYKKKLLHVVQLFQPQMEETSHDCMLSREICSDLQLLNGISKDVNLLKEQTMNAYINADISGENKTSNAAEAAAKRKYVVGCKSLKNCTEVAGKGHKAKRSTLTKLAESFATGFSYGSGVQTVNKLFGFFKKKPIQSQNIVSHEEIRIMIESSIINNEKLALLRHTDSLWKNIESAIYSKRTAANDSKMVMESVYTTLAKAEELASENTIMSLDLEGLYLGISGFLPRHWASTGQLGSNLLEMEKKLPTGFKLLYPRNDLNFYYTTPLVEHISVVNGFAILEISIPIIAEKSSYKLQKLIPIPASYGTFNICKLDIVEEIVMVNEQTGVIFEADLRFIRECIQNSVCELGKFNYKLHSSYKCLNGDGECRTTCETTDGFKLVIFRDDVAIGVAGSHTAKITSSNGKTQRHPMTSDIGITVYSLECGSTLSINGITLLAASMTCSSDRNFKIAYKIPRFMILNKREGNSTVYYISDPSREMELSFFGAMFAILMFVEEFFDILSYIRLGLPIFFNFAGYAAIQFFHLRIQ